jgi:hypothetical protein
MVIESFHPESVVEFGLGLFSTELLLTHCQEVMSVEMQSSEWYRRMVAMYHPRHAWNPVLALGPYAFLGISYPKAIDLILVDGHGESRPEVVNFAFRLGCKMVIAHDTEEAGYGWERVNPCGYDRYDFNSAPSTAVWLPEGTNFKPTS